MPSCMSVQHDKGTHRAVERSQGEYAPGGLRGGSQFSASICTLRAASGTETTKLPSSIISRGTRSSQTRIGNHTFRATGITAYLKNSGTLETAQHIANHESPRTTKLYDRRQEFAIRSNASI